MSSFDWNNDKFRLEFIKYVNLKQLHLKTTKEVTTKWAEAGTYLCSIDKREQGKTSCSGPGAKLAWKVIKDDFYKRHKIDENDLKNEDVDKLEKLSLEDKDEESLLRDMILERMKEIIDLTVSKKEEEKKKGKLDVAAKATLDKAGNSVIAKVVAPSSSNDSSLSLSSAPKNKKPKLLQSTPSSDVVDLTAASSLDSSLAKLLEPDPLEVMMKEELVRQLKLKNDKKEYKFQKQKEKEKSKKRKHQEMDNKNEGEGEEGQRYAGMIVRMNND